MRSVGISIVIINAFGHSAVRENKRSLFKNFWMRQLPPHPFDMIVLQCEKGEEEKLIIMLS